MKPSVRLLCAGACMALILGLSNAASADPEDHTDSHGGFNHDGQPPGVSTLCWPPVQGDALGRKLRQGRHRQLRPGVLGQPGLHFQLNDYAGLAGFNGCHDISVFMELKLAASACMSEGQIWDLSDLENPTTVGRIHNPNVEFWHSASFAWDGTTVLFGDEAGGGTSPRGRTRDPDTLGAIWIYDVASATVTDGTTQQPALSHFKIPRPQGDVARCTMHNFNTLPTADRYVAVAAAYSGGTTVFDFTDRENPKEVGHNDPHGANTWSSYWYTAKSSPTTPGADSTSCFSRTRYGPGQRGCPT